MVYGQATLCTFDLKQFGPSFPPLPLPDGQPVLQFIDTVVHLNTVIIRSSVLGEVGLLNETVYAAEDMDFTVRVARKFRVAAIQRPVALVRGRYSDGSMPRNETLFWLSRAKDDLRLVRSHLIGTSKLLVNPSTGNKILRSRAGWYVHKLLTAASLSQSFGDRSYAGTAALGAFRISPLHSIKNPLFYRSLYAATMRRLAFNSRRSADN